MSTLGRILIPLAVLAGPLGAVYAPIPEEELGKALVITVGGGVYHDDNIFGAPSGERSSMVYRFAPSIDYNSSVTDQTFVSLGYDLSFDHIENRPTNTDLISHVLSARIAHSYNPDSVLDLNNLLMVNENPESLLPGLPLNTDQSFVSNQFDGTFTNKLGERTGYSLKARSQLYAYDLNSLAAQLDRHELLLGVTADYSVSEATSMLGEYRFQDVSYDAGGALKDKRSHFLLAGLDHSPSEAVSLSMRLGLEQRNRSGAPDDDAPRAELMARYSYGENSFLSGGYMYTIEEVSNVAAYTDVQVHRFFVSLQHALSPAMVGSLFYNVEPSTLLGRSGITTDQDETTQRFGMALTMQPSRGWTLSGTFDMDITASGDAFRDLDRQRVGINVSRSF
jgi:hypothetical protein